MGYPRLAVILASVLVWSTHAEDVSPRAASSTTPFSNSSSATSFTYASAFTTGPNSPFDLRNCPNYPMFNCYRDGDPIFDWQPPGYFQADGDFISPYNTTENPFNIVPPNTDIANQCGVSFTSRLSTYLSTAPVTTSFYTGLASTEAPWISYVGESFTWKPEKPCCLNCTMIGGTVQILAWPTPAPDPSVSTLVDVESNYTFTSPSMYVIFQSLAASDWCGGVGGTYVSKTLAFDETDLSTATYSHAPHPNAFETDTWGTYDCASQHGFWLVSESWEPFNYQSIESGKCIDHSTSIGGGPYAANCTWNPCSPYMSVPTQIFGVDPAFAACQTGITAFIDPPTYLTAGPTLKPFSAVAGAATTTTPAPQQTPVPDIASKTTAPTVVADPTQTPVVPVVPASSDPASDPASNPSPSNDPPANTPSANDPSPSDTHSNDPPATTAPANDPTSSNPPANDPPASTTSTNDPPPTDPQTNDPPAISPVSSTPPANDPPANPHPSNTPAGSGPAATTPLPNDPQTKTSPSNNPPSSDPSQQQSSVPNVVPSDPATNSPIGGGLQTATDGTVVYIKGSQTFTAGAPAATIGSTIYSLAPSGSYLIIDGTSTSLIPPIPQPSSEPYYLVGTQTLIPGGAAITVSGTTASLLPGGESIVVGTVTEPVGSVLAPSGTGSGSPGATTTGQGVGGAIASLGGFVSVDPSTSSPVSGYNGTVFTGDGFRMRPGIGGIVVVIWVTLVFN